TRAFAHGDHVLNLLIAGFDRQRNDDIVNHLAHEDLLELLESADHLIRNQIVCGGAVRRSVHKAHHFVAMLPVMADLCVGALGQTTMADNEGSARVTVARTNDGSPAGSHQETEGGGEKQEIRQLPHRQAAAHARQRKSERQSGSSGGGGDQTTDLGSELPKTSGLVEAEHVKDNRPGGREDDEEQYGFYADARRKEAVHAAAWDVREVHANEHPEYRHDGGQAVETRDQASAAYQ